MPNFFNLHAPHYNGYVAMFGRAARGSQNRCPGRGGAAGRGAQRNEARLFFSPPRPVRRSFDGGARLLTTDSWIHSD